MKLHVDKEADALYLHLDASVITESEEISSGVVLDYNESNQVVAWKYFISRNVPKNSIFRPSNSRRFSQGSQKAGM